MNVLVYALVMGSETIFRIVKININLFSSEKLL